VLGLLAGEGVGAAGRPEGAAATGEEERVTANGVPAIETRYKGYRFRSRLEARWAVFFDVLHVEWEYEPQGFHLPSGAYLPDFWLPTQEVWVEVKGKEPSDHELLKAQQLADASQRPVAIFVGQIPESDTLREKLCGFDESWGCGRMVWPACAAGRDNPVSRRLALFHCGEIYNGEKKEWFPGCGHFDLASFHDSDWTCKGCGDFATPMLGYAIERAYDAARGARFEHGETPSW
jgi:hypothetical protein